MGKSDSPKKGLGRASSSKRGRGRTKSETKSPEKKSETNLATDRKKRVIVPKNKELTGGLSWNEQKELEKALRASLHKRTTLLPPKIHRTLPRSPLKLKRGPKKGLRLLMPNKGMGHRPAGGSSLHDSHVTSSTNNSTSVSGQVTPTMVDVLPRREQPKIDGCRVRAQRKFAQGSMPCSPCVTPVKQQSRVPSPVKFMMQAPPKTEDFIEFLCLRNTNRLRKELEHFNYCDPNLYLAMNTPVKTTSNVANSNSSRTTSRPDTPVSNDNSNYSNCGADVRVKGTRGRKKSRQTGSGYHRSKGTGSRSPVNKAYASCYAPPSTAPKELNGPDDYHGNQADISSESVIETRARAVFDRPMKLRSFSQCGDHGNSDVEAAMGQIKEKFDVIKTEPHFESSVNSSFMTKSSLSKSPRSVKKERGMKLVKKARETIARRDRTKKNLYSDEVEDKYSNSSQSQGDEKGRRITRSLQEKREIEQFKEEKLQTLYSNKGGAVEGLVISEKHPSKLHRRKCSEQSGKKTHTKSHTRSLEVPDISPAKRSRMDKTTVIDLTVSSPSPRRQSTSASTVSESDSEGMMVLRSNNTASPGRIPDSSPHRSPNTRHLASRKGKSPGRASLTSDRSDSGKNNKTSKTRKKLDLPPLTLPPMFPLPSDPAKVVAAPTYHPSEEKFIDPVEYIESIRAQAQPYGLCAIEPPTDWKPMCCVSQELRFITEVQHLHRMKDRWGPNAFEMECIRKHLASQGQRLESLPVIGGMEMDLPALSQAIRECGGIHSVADDKKKWMKVADILRIPKWSQDRSFKLYDAYCKYLLSYDSLSYHEHERLRSQVSSDRARGRLTTDCVLKGRSRSLAEFYNWSRAMLVRWFDHDPTAEQAEAEYWKILDDQREHIAVHCAHVDTKHCGGGFPVDKNSLYSPHGWNFNVLRHSNPHSVLRHLGSVSGVTIPELHMGMLFSTNCWCSDPHGLPYISYIHTGNEIIWYCIPKSEELKFKKVLQDLSPDLIDADSPIWLPVDSIMLSPEDLVSAGVSVCRAVQKANQFMVVFPQSFTATICVGYNISESIRYATAEWIPTGYTMSLALHDSYEPELFSMEQLLIQLATTQTNDILRNIMEPLEHMINKEIEWRKKLEGAGLKHVQRLDVDKTSEITRKKRGIEEENRCETSKKICYLSMVLNESDGTVYSLEHAYPLIHRKKNLKHYKMLYRHTERELLDILNSVKTKYRAL